MHTVFCRLSTKWGTYSDTQTTINSASSSNCSISP